MRPSAPPYLRRRVVAVVAPVHDAQPASLDHDETVIPRAGIVWRLDLSGPGIFRGSSCSRRSRSLNPFRACPRGRAGVMSENVYRPINRSSSTWASSRCSASWSKCAWVDAPDVGRSDREIVKVPVPAARGVVAPRIDHDAHPVRRGDPERGAAVVGDLDRAVARRRLIGLNRDHPVVIARHPPDVQTGVDIGHG